MRNDPLSRLRGICLALPEAHEKEAWGAPTFRVRNKLFAMFVDNHHGDGRVAVWCKASREGQDALVSSDPERFFVPPYVGHSGWVGIRLEGKVDWRLVAYLLEEGYRMTAPKRLFARIATVSRTESSRGAASAKTHARRKASGRGTRRPAAVRPSSLRSRKTRPT